MKGGESITIVHYKCKNIAPGSNTKPDDFIVYIDDVDEYEKWKGGDRSIPVAQFAKPNVYTSHKQGTRAAEDQVSKRDLENEFGDLSEDEILIKILEENDDVQNTRLGERQGFTNESMSDNRAK